MQQQLENLAENLNKIEENIFKSQSEEQIY